MSLDVYEMHLFYLTTLLFLLSACGTPVDSTLLVPAAFKYIKPLEASCIAQSKNGNAGLTNNVETGSGATYNLRTPTNYNATFAHPLIVVYAPAGTSASKSERHVHLTKEATEAGFVVAYAENIRLSLPAIKKVSVIPSDIQKKWCIDPARIYYTGHSDGGTITNALTFLPEIASKPNAIAPSAAGMNAESLEQYKCPPALPVMVFHNAQDNHFEGFGKQAADWWANCNQCSNELIVADNDGCRIYKNCPNGAKTYYCEGEGSHSDWPNKNSVLIDFFNSKN